MCKKPGTLERWQVFVSDAAAAIFSICVLILASPAASGKLWLQMAKISQKRSLSVVFHTFFDTVFDVTFLLFPAKH